MFSEPSLSICSVVVVSLLTVLTPTFQCSLVIELRDNECAWELRYAINRNMVQYTTTEVRILVIVRCTS